MLRRLAVVSFLLLGTQLVSPFAYAQPAASLDVAALTLRPADIGQPGWVHLGAFVQSLRAEAADVAGYRGEALSANDVATQMQSFGWKRSYVAVLGVRSTDASTAPSQIIRSYITEYADATGAAAGFAYLEDESDVPTAEDVPLDQPLGDEAEATRDRGSTESRPFRSLDVTFRVGAFVAGVTVVNSGTRAFTDPSLPEAERLARIVAARFAAPPSPGTTLGGLILRLGGDGQTFTTYDDAYYRLGEIDVPLVDESAAAAAARTATYANATDVYQLWQGVDVTEAGGVLYGVTLLRFPNAEAASIWLQDLAQLLGENPFYGDLSSVSAPALGDQAVALTYVPGGGGPEGPRARLLAVRVGVEVARVHLVPQGELTDVPPSAVEELTRQQVDCLQTMICGATGIVPAALTASPVAASPVPVPSMASGTPEARTVSDS